MAKKLSSTVKLARTVRAKVEFKDVEMGRLAESLAFELNAREAAGEALTEEEKELFRAVHDAELALKRAHELAGKVGYGLKDC